MSPNCRMLQNPRMSNKPLKPISANSLDTRRRSACADAHLSQITPKLLKCHLPLTKHIQGLLRLPYVSGQNTLPDDLNFKPPLPRCKRRLRDAVIGIDTDNADFPDIKLLQETVELFGLERILNAFYHDVVYKTIEWCKQLGPRCSLYRQPFSKKLRNGLC